MVRNRERGFTLLELIIVVAMIGILASIAMPALKDMPTRAKESVLKTNLRTLREVIDQFYGDKGRYPASLDELVETKYLRSVPFDPFTKSSQTWVLTYEEAAEGEEEAGPPATGEEESQGPGIVDVHSGATAKSLPPDSRPYAEW